jgi:hypothetical protein
MIGQNHSLRNPIVYKFHDDDDDYEHKLKDSFSS